MSLESPWLALAGGLLIPALGHIYHFILIVNITSGMGYAERTLGRVRHFLLFCLFLSAGLLLWKHLSDPWWNWAWPLKGYGLLCLISGGLILPGSSLALQLRPRPRSVSGRTELLDLAQGEEAESFVGRGRGSWILRLPGNESLQLRRHEWTLHYPSLPVGLEGLEVLQISDLHFAPCYDRRYFEKVVEACSIWSPDLLVITGDLVDDDDVLDWIGKVLGPLEARIGKFAILGNHDAECHMEGILAELSRAGFESLEGKWSSVLRDGARIALGGTSAPWGPRLDPRQIPTADFRLLLSHSPDQFYVASRWGIDLVLCGHNHGGQIRVPGFGPLFMPSIYSRRFDRGFFQRGSMLMYVNEGVGGKHPYRLGCPPEVSHFVLTPKQGSSPALIRVETSERIVNAPGDIGGPRNESAQI